MSAVVSDTHTLLWYLNDSSKLSSDALAAFERAEQNGLLIYVPAIILNFAFLKDEWASVFNSAAKAEHLARTDSRTACFHARRALELGVDWIYEYDDELRAPYDNNLSSKIFADDFKAGLSYKKFINFSVTIKLSKSSAKFSNWAFLF